MERRVVITGLGVISPNGTTLADFNNALKHGISGIRHQPDLAALGFSCQIAGKPELSDARIAEYFNALEIRNLDATGIVYGVIAALDAWADAGLNFAAADEPFWDCGISFGTGTSGIDKFRWAMNKIDALEVRKIGSSVVGQVMNGAVSAFIAGKIGLGNQISTNSSACATGTESVIMAYERIKLGTATRILAGSTSDSGPYIWGGFDAMKICPYQFNDNPEKASRPFSATASGFVPGAGAGALVLEDLETALERGAKIYGEVLGGHVNSGGQRGSGTMTAPNSVAVKRCITKALESANTFAKDVEVINGHLTATAKDGLEVLNWKQALGRYKDNFPFINSIKGMIGHCISGAGSIECVASVLQLYEGFIFPNINCEDLHPEITDLIDAGKIPQQMIKKDFSILAKASFGFGDVNACLILKKYPNG
ncbi:3-oxoacyl-(acyl-carrier-protein) synthase [Pedobacter sp. UYP30]|uniref:beta-ketoacyl-[acyl-carrier-protein] synthase family protein n=1 Tax=Pedobacter sp. UYP30 TaxID=1756400 RepID=UPI00339082EB